MMGVWLTFGWHSAVILAIFVVAMAINGRHHLHKPNTVDIIYMTVVGNLVAQGISNDKMAFDQAIIAVVVLSLVLITINKYVKHPDQLI